MTGYVALMDKLEAAENEILRLKAKSRRRAETDDQSDDPGIADRVTAPDRNEEPTKRQPKDENVSDEELDRRGKEIAEEIERRRREKQKKSDPEDTSSTPNEPLEESTSLGDSRYAQDSRYKKQVDSAAAFILRVHSEVTTGRAPPKPAESTSEMFAIAEHLPPDQRVKALSAYIVAADKRRRGES